jgi:hypothetical protein
MRIALSEPEGAIFIYLEVWMTTTFMKAKQVMFTSESVTEGHPDKLCDQISDAVLDACLEQDPYSRVACVLFSWARSLQRPKSTTTNWPGV